MCFIRVREQTNKQTNRLKSYCFRGRIFVLRTQIITYSWICSTNYKVIDIACIFPTYHIGLTKKMNLLHVTYYHESKNHIKNYQNRTIDKYFCIVIDLLIWNIWYDFLIHFRKLHAINRFNIKPCTPKCFDMW